MHNDIARDYNTGVSHFTADFFEVLEIGMDGIRKKAKKSLAGHTDPKKIDFIKSCLHCIDCMDIWRKRYIAELSKRDGFEESSPILNKFRSSLQETFTKRYRVFGFVLHLCVLQGHGRASAE